MRPTLPEPTMRTRFAGLDEVAVDEGLEGTGAIDARKAVAREEDALLAGARRYDQCLEIDEGVVPVVEVDARGLVLVDADHGRGGKDSHVGEGADIGLELPGYVESPGAGIAVLLGAEELVGLEDEFASKARLVVRHDDREAALRELDRRGKAGRAAAHDEDVRGKAAFPRARGGQVVSREDRKPVEAPDVHSGREGGHAGLAREAVNDDGALGALAVRAEYALGRAVLGVAGKGHDARCRQGGRNGLAVAARAGRSVEPEVHHASRLGRAHDGVTRYAIHCDAPIDGFARVPTQGGQDRGASLPRKPSLK